MDECRLKFFYPSDGVWLKYFLVGVPNLKLMVRRYPSLPQVKIFILDGSIPRVAWAAFFYLRISMIPQLKSLLLRTYIRRSQFPARFSLSLERNVVFFPRNLGVGSEFKIFLELQFSFAVFSPVKVYFRPSINLSQCSLFLSRISRKNLFIHQLEIFGKIGRASCRERV